MPYKTVCIKSDEPCTQVRIEFSENESDVVIHGISVQTSDNNTLTFQSDGRFSRLVGGSAVGIREADNEIFNKQYAGYRALSYELESRKVDSSNQDQLFVNVIQKSYDALKIQLFP